MKALQVPPPQSASVVQSGTLEQPQGQKPVNFFLKTVERLPPSSHSGRLAAAAEAGEAKAAGAATPATAACGASPARAGRAASRARARVAKRTVRAKGLDMSGSSFLI